MTDPVPVARKYALALFRAALRREVLDPVGADLDSIVRMLRGEPQLAKVLAAPDVPAAEKRKLAAGVLAGRVGPVALEFVDLLLDKRRFGLLEAAAARYRELLEEERGMVRARAVTAVGLTDAERAGLLDKLQRVTGKTVLMSETVDPEILGGVVVTVGVQIIDGSVRGALRELRERLLAAPLAR